MSIIYAVISSKNATLCEYSDFHGTFEQISAKLLKKVEPNTKGTFEYEGKYTFPYWNIDNITYMCMCDSTFPPTASIAFLDSLSKEFAQAYPTPVYEMQGAYSLNDEFKEKMKMKMEYFNKNKDAPASGENIAILKQGLVDMKNNWLETQDILDQRGEKIRWIVQKADQLNETSSTFYNSARNVRKQAEWRKIKLIIFIVLCVWAGIYLLLSIFCGFTMKKCIGNDK